MQIESHCTDFCNLVEVCNCCVHERESIWEGIFETHGALVCRRIRWASSWYRCCWRQCSWPGRHPSLAHAPTTCRNTRCACQRWWGRSLLFPRWNAAPSSRPRTSHACAAPLATPKSPTSTARRLWCSPSTAESSPRALLLAGVINSLQPTSSAFSANCS